MRLIDADAAIDAISEMMPTPYTPDGSHPADEGIFIAQELFADCIQTIEDLPTIEPPQWIPCSERLPEEDGRYLVCGAKGGIYHANYRRRYWTQVGCGGKPVPTVVAWMPLPKAYEVKE